MIHFNFIAQNKEEITNSYTIDIYVVDDRNETPIPNANVEIFGTDSSNQEFKTDSLGFLSITRKFGVRYTTIVGATGYLNAKGTETGPHGFRILNHTYLLQPLELIQDGFKQIDLDSTFTIDCLRELKDTIVFYAMNSIVKPHSIKTILNKNGKQYFLTCESDSSSDHSKNINNPGKLKVKLTNEKDVVILNLNGEERKYWIRGVSTKGSQRYELFPWSD